MKKEIDLAVNWIVEKGFTTFKEEKERANIFKRILFEELMKKYDNHWYEDNREKGSGYRALICDEYQIDCIILKALKLSNINPNLVEFDNFVLFVNPGEVKCKIGDRGLIVDNVYIEVN
jgi:hypothetical protein